MSQNSSDELRSVLVRRSDSEQSAYLAGQRAALTLVRDKGIDYAQKIIDLHEQRRTTLANTYQDADNLSRYRDTGELVPDDVEVRS